MRYATRGRVVDSESRYKVLAPFPGHGPATRRPLPSPGSLRHKFPGFTGTMERSDSRTSVPPSFVSFGRRLLPRAPVLVAPHKPDAGLGPGVFGSGHPQKPAFVEGETHGRPKFLGDPSCAYALFSDPGRTGRTRPLRCADMAPARSTTKAPSKR